MDKNRIAYHGGAFFNAIGADFTAMENARKIISADVLDAWFDPSPRAIAKIQEYLPWLIKTSPPTQCEGLINTIVDVRGIPGDCVLVGGGSSDIIYTFLLNRECQRRKSASACARRER